MTKGPRRLASRVALAATGSGALAGALAAFSAVVAVDHMVSNQADRRLRGAADVLAGELDEGFEEGEWEPLAEIVADENSELVTSGVRLGVFSGGHRIAGDSWVPPTPAGRCELHGPLGRRTRACGRAHAEWVLVAATESDEAALRAIYASAGLGALLLGGAVGALAGLRLSRWALRPLSDLGRSIRSIRPGDSEQGDLGPRSDVEEIELIRSSLAELLGHVKALLGQSTRFAADAAHELRMPLTTIRGELDLLVEDAGRPADRVALERIRRRTGQLSELVERLLVLAMPIGVLDPPFTAVALADVIEDVVGRLPSDQRDRVRMDLRGEGMVRGDEALLASVISNAIDNALKFSRELPVDVALDEPRARVRSGDTGDDLRTGELVSVEVRDRGPGLTAELRDRVFEPFFRARPDATPGHGLGLSLIAHIVRAHGGSVAFVTTGEGGSCLRMILPAWRPGSEARPADGGHAARDSAA